jgi:hypothetical protein
MAFMAFRMIPQRDFKQRHVQCAERQILTQNRYDKLIFKHGVKTVRWLIQSILYTAYLFLCNFSQEHESVHLAKQSNTSTFQCMTVLILQRNTVPRALPPIYNSAHLGFSQRLRRCYCHISALVLIISEQDGNHWTTFRSRWCCR